MALSWICLRKTGQLLPTALNGIMQVALQEILVRQYTQTVNLTNVIENTVLSPVVIKGIT